MGDNFAVFLIFLPHHPSKLHLLKSTCCCQDFSIFCMTRTFHLKRYESFLVPLMWCCYSFLSILINGLAPLRGILTILELQKHSPLPALCNSNDIPPLIMRIHHPSQHGCPCSGGLTQWYESWVVVSTSGSVGPSLCLWCRKQPPWETEAVGIGSKICTSVWVGMTAPLLCLSVGSQMLIFLVWKTTTTYW